MNKDHRIKLLKKINEGTQNRYGEIEYSLSEPERIEGLKNILYSINKFPLDEEESQILSSIIYWNLCSTGYIVDSTLHLISEYYNIAVVKNSFLECFKKKYTMHSRVERLNSYLRDFKKLNLSFDKFIDDIVPILKSYREEKEWIDYEKKIQTILESYKIDFIDE